jgi:hypothetical protein
MKWIAIINPSAKYDRQEVIVEGVRTQQAVKDVIESRYPGASVWSIRPSN